MGFLRVPVSCVGRGQASLEGRIMQGEHKRYRCVCREDLLSAHSLQDTVHSNRLSLVP